MKPAMQAATAALEDALRERDEARAEVERLREALADIHDMCARRLDEKRPRFSPLFALAIGEKAREALNGKES